MHKDKIIYRDELKKEDKETILQGLDTNAYEKRGVGKNNGLFSFVIEGEDGKLKAGMSGFNYYGCFYIDMLFVADEFRSGGHGSILMQKAEELAKKRKCFFMAVNTMDFEAGPFYEKHGFSVEFTRTGFEKGVEMHFLQKKL